MSALPLRPPPRLLLERAQAAGLDVTHEVLEELATDEFGRTLTYAEREELVLDALTLYAESRRGPGTRDEPRTTEPTVAKMTR